MLVNFVTKGVNSNLTALTEISAGVEVGQVAMLTNLDTAVATIAPSTLLSVPRPSIILQAGGRLLLMWNGSCWLCAHPVPQYVLAASAEVDDALVAPNRVTMYLDEDGDDLILKAKYSDGSVATAAISLTPDA